MKKITKIFFLLLFSINIFAQKDGWEFLKNVDGINVYTKTNEGDAFKELKLQTTFTCNMDVLVAALQDVSSYPNWVYRAAKSEKIQKINDWECVYYNYLDFPWPATDRDVLIYNKIYQNPKTKLVVSESIARNTKEVPVQKDVHRIVEMRSKWVVKPTEKGLYAEYYFRSNPGGDLPAWAVNSAIEEGPIKTIQGLKKLIYAGKFNSYPNKLILN